MIYLFDKDEKLIKIVRKSAVKTALQKYALTTEHYVSDRLTVELKGLNADELEQVEYMAIQTMEDAHTFHYFYVAQKSSDELTTLIGVQSGIEELRKSPVFDKRPQNAFARDVITDLLVGTNWQARFVGETTPHSTNFYYTSVFDALKKVCEVWDLEMQFFVEMNGNRIGGRYIDFKQRIGEAVGKRVVYGHNALQILQEVERTNIFTALIGRGKGEETGAGYGRKITFEDVTWSTAQGKPVNKPKGQKYLELPLMTRQYGIKNADGSMRPKIGFVDFSEEENPEILIERTYKALIDSARPQLTLKTSSVYLKGVKIGDTIRVVRHDKKLDYDTRIFEITFNRLNNQSSDIKLGDRIGESNEAKVQTIADKAVEQFITNEFSTFVQNLPNHLPSADGFNNNWYGAEDPTVQYPSKVLINDIWFKPDPEHEGHKIMLRWTGEVWEEILRTYDSESLRDRIAEEIAQVNQSMQAQSEEHDRQVADILAKTQSVEELANQAKTNAASAIQRSSQLKAEAVAEANRLVQAQGTALTERIQSVDVRVDDVANQVSSKVSQIDFDAVKKTVESNSTAITQNQSAIELKADKTVTDALATAVNQTKSELKIASDAVATKVSKTDFDATNQRLSTAETTIRTQAGQIEQRLTSTQVESAINAKGYQTKAQVDNNITGRGYITNSALQPYALSTTVQNLVKETSDSFSRTISETKALIPSDFGGYNLVQNGAFPTEISPWSGPVEIAYHEFYFQRTKPLFLLKTSSSSEILASTNRFELRRNTDYTLSFRGFSSSNIASVDVLFLARKSTETNSYSTVKEIINKQRLSTSEVQYVTVTFNSGENDSAFLRFDNNGSTNGGLAFFFFGEVMLVEGRTARKWEPSYDELITVTKFHEVKDTVDSHTRTIGNIEGNVSQVTQTAQGLVSQVSSLVDNQNLVYDPTNYSMYAEREPVSNLVVTGTGEYKLLRITQSGLTANAWKGFKMPLHSQKFVAGEKLSYRVNLWVDVLPDARVGFEIKAGSSIAFFSIHPNKTGGNQIFTGTFTVSKTVTATDEFGLHVWLEKNGTVAIGQISIVRGDKPPSSFVDATSAMQLAISTKVSQLDGSWAVQNLTNSGTVLNQLNLNKDGSVKIDGKLVQITGTTYIQDGVITSAKIAGLDAGKITTGTLDAARIAVNSIDGSKMVFDQAFVNKMTANEAYLKQLFAKNAFITQVQAVTLSASKIAGGVLTATNKAMEVNLNDGQILYYTDQAALKRILTNYPTQFVKFATGTVTGKGNAGVTVIGSNRRNSESSNDGGFVGIRAWNGSNIDQIDVVGDTVRLASSTFEKADGWIVNTLPRKLDIDAYNNSDRPSSKLHIGDINIYRTDSVFVSLKDVLQQFNHNFKHLVNITGRGDVILTWDTIK
ncbi:phage tail spike protein [Streptococcus suis]|nr:phage tail spike protein [Streptococcus suis]